MSGNIKIWSVLLILILCLIPEYNFTVTEINWSRKEVKLRKLENDRQTCSYGEAVLYGSECVICTGATLAKHGYNFDTQVAESSTNRSILSSSIADSKYFDRPTTFELGFDCPALGENIAKRRIAVGARKLNGIVLKIVSIDRLPFSKVHEGQFSGVVFEVLSALQTKYNFSIHAFLPYDGNWGAQEKNGTWNGMVGQILRKEADVGAAAFSVTVQRAAVVDFTVPYHEEPTAILIPAPSEGEKLTVIIRPFSQEVWAALFITIGILMPTFYLLHICSLSIRNDEDLKPASFVSILSGNLMFVTGSLVQESVRSPGNKTTRFLIAIWWMATLILANIYMAFLVSYLSVPKLSNLVDSLEDLAAQSKIKWTFRKGTAHESLFKSSSSVGTFKVIGDQVSDDQMVTSDQDGVKSVLTKGVAFIKEKSFLDVALENDFMENKKCRLTLAKQDFFTVGIAFAVQKKSPYLSLFDFEISNAQATGLLTKWKTIHWPSDLWCADAASFIISTQPATRMLTTNDLQGAFFLLACGILSAVVGLILEKLYTHMYPVPMVTSAKALLNPLKL